MPLTSITKKNIFFHYLSTCQSAFNSLKKIITEARILSNYKQDIKIIVETNLSSYVSNKFFFRLGNNGLLHPDPFFLKNLNPAKCKYEINNK